MPIQRFCVWNQITNAVGIGHYGATSFEPAHVVFALDHKLRPATIGFNFPLAGIGLQRDAIDSFDDRQEFSLRQFRFEQRCEWQRESGLNCRSKSVLALRHWSVLNRAWIGNRKSAHRMYVDMPFAVGHRHHQTPERIVVELEVGRRRKSIRHVRC